MKRVLVTSLILAAAVSANADVILNTFGTSGPPGFIGTGWSVNSSQYMGRAFNSPGSYTLSQIDIALFGDGGNVTVSLCNDGGSGPGSVLESFVVTTTGTPTKYSLNSVTNPLMTTGTYYISVVPTNPSTFGAWCQTDDGHTANMVFSTNQGGTWNGFNDVDGAVTVFGNLVPEPGSMAVLGFGALALLRRRRK